jgi:MFS transporter, FSR family, fosmidomycin resistance protein
MTFMLIEFLDELVFGVAEAAWPFIRSDLGLNYVQIGLALSLPGFLANFIEPFLAILGDVWKRRALILGGGIIFAFSLFLISSSISFSFLLFSFILINPASGAFVGLSQAALMDSDPVRREQNMARWNFAGSLAVVLGPLLLGVAAYIGFGWRGVFAALGALTAIILVIAWRRIPASGIEHPSVPRWDQILAGLRNAISALRNRETLRWLILLEFSDLMGDVLYGFIALYFVDVAGLSSTQAVLAVAIWSGVGLLADFLLIPLLERVRGLDAMRLTVLAEGILFPIFLLTPDVTGKLVLLAMLGIFNTGWYVTLQAKLYDSMPAGMSSSAMALGNLAGIFGKLLPFGIGLAAQTYGLGAAMWLLLAGPLALLIGLPRTALRASSN